MSVGKCKDCGGQVSSSAKVCPHCGRPQTMSTWKAFCIVIAMAVGLAFLSKVIDGYRDYMARADQAAVASSAPVSKPAPSARFESPAAALAHVQRMLSQGLVQDARSAANWLLENHAGTPEATKAQEVVTAAEAKGVSAADAKIEAERSEWAYEVSAEEMGRGQVKSAWIRSSNTVTFGFPYGGPQNATLTLRSHPQHGKDVILSFKEAHFLCPSYDGCTLFVRFDDGKVRNFHAVSPSDHSTNVLFIRGFDTFLASAKKAKVMRLQPEFYQKGRPVLEFRVANLKWPPK